MTYLQWGMIMLIIMTISTEALLYLRMRRFHWLAVPMLAWMATSFVYYTWVYFDLPMDEHVMSQSIRLQGYFTVFMLSFYRLWKAQITYE